VGFAAGRNAARLALLGDAGATALSLDLFDAGAVRRAVDGHDAVINVATRVPAPSRILVPGAWREMDRVRTEGAAILAAAVAAAGVGRLVQESYAPIYAGMATAGSPTSRRCGPRDTTVAR
jgi:nucleoside-diphosphate-sugar epimerase